MVFDKNFGSLGDFYKSAGITLLETPLRIAEGLQNLYAGKSLVKRNLNDMQEMGERAGYLFVPMALVGLAELFNYFNGRGF